MRFDMIGERLAVAIAVAVSVGWPVPPAAAAQPRPGTYPYRSAAFTTFLRDSDREVPSPVQPFYEWFEQAYAHSPARLPGQDTLLDALASRAQAIRAAGDARRRTEEELNTAIWSYRLIKATIPHFSLARGYEFVWTVQFGERQCLLQSVLMAGLLQAAGADAGVAMVWKNMVGQESNNGHAVTILRLSDGRDVEVDASEPRPVATHQGIFAATRRGGYRFLEPVFDRDGFITAYRPAAGQGARLRPQDIRLLGLSFLRSQFYYYRGEQVPGGLVNGPATPQGLRTAARQLEHAVRFDARNPLAVYMLGRVYLRSGEGGPAKTRLRQAYTLYKDDGYLPAGLLTALASAGMP